MSDKNPYEAAFRRERQARLKAERLLEDKARSLYTLNKELATSNQQLRDQQSLIIRQEKMATIGTLAAGVAHEINNPLAFVSSNIEALKDYWQSSEVLYQAILSIKEATPAQEVRENLHAIIAKEDLAYAYEDAVPLFADTAEGLKRITEIIANLRMFTRTQSSDRLPFDLNKGVESTLRILGNQINLHQITVERALGEIPEVSCNPGEINQILLNLAVNAIHALEHAPERIIHVQTQADHQYVHVSVADSGAGIPQDIIGAIFSPFFTTKEMGKGTGMGLAISKEIADEHKGSLVVSNQPSGGAKFTLSLPIKHSGQHSPEEASR